MGRIDGPELKDKGEQPYAAIRTKTAMKDLPTVIPQSIGQVFEWLEKRGTSPSGPSFIRYLVINMATKLEIELGFPVAKEMPGEGMVTTGVLPAGHYASLTYTGDYSGLMAANATLLEWGAKKNLKWDTFESKDGDGFGARLEWYLVDPHDEPDPSKWKTEVAIRLAD